MLVILIYIFDKLRQLFDPTFILGDQAITNNLESLLVEVTIVHVLRETSRALSAHL